MTTQDFFIANTHLVLDARKVIFWPMKASLFIADLHLGKITHFRKSGISIPSEAVGTNFMILESLFIDYCPENCYFLGDLFHSAANEEWIQFQNLCLKFPNIKFTLISGNHDKQIIKYITSNRFDWLIIHDFFELPPFLLTHEPISKEDENKSMESKNLFRLCGHYHPKIKINGKGNNN